ncbi:hypothetical protein C8R41DRAFT_845957 [Lentinula lateritia]|uniref:Uncharacterized protein n=1 Tax=Lentinula lateritia TaxID=40482 RepID=A0ABQ8V6D8_9AGAR|nr:hypothetical protein C8R41DRAFT_845957 [Lentinula lateritia]
MRLPVLQGYDHGLMCNFHLQLRHFVNIFDADLHAAFGTRVLAEADLGSVTAETIDLNHEGMRVYQEAKTLADKAIWDLALSNPKIDFTVLPPAIFGPQFSTDVTLTSSASSLGTNAFVQMLFTPEYLPIPIGHMIDVRDAARAHVLALSIPPVPGRHKRFIISNRTFLWKDIESLIRRRKPELAGRLPKETSVPGPQTSAPMETTFAKEVLGMTSYISQEVQLLKSFLSGRSSVVGVACRFIASSLGPLFNVLEYLLIMFYLKWLNKSYC